MGIKKYLGELQGLSNFLKELNWSYIKKNLVSFIIIYGLAICTILRANVNYIDDLGRTAFGYRGWENFSRWISEYGSILVHGKTYLTDMSPMPQLLAVLIIALASTVVLYVFVDEKKYRFLNVVAVLPLGISPYFLECLSYKYDSTYMALSVLGVVFPFLFITYSRIYFMVFSFIGLLVMCMTYQASSGIYLLMLVFYCLKRFNSDDKIEHKELFKILLIGLLCFGFSLGVYKIFFVKIADTYVSSELPKSGLLTTVYNNSKTYIGLLINDMPKIWKVLICAIVSMTTLNIIVRTKRNKLIALVVFIGAVCVSLVLSYGAYLALQKPLFATRAMYGFGAFIALLSILGITVWSKNYVLRLVCCFLSWCLFGYAFLYGNALAEQKRYAEFRMQMVISDLNNLPINPNIKSEKILVRGTTLNSPVVERWIEKYPVLGREAHSQFAGSGWVWHTAYFYNYYGLLHFEKLYIDKEKTSLEKLNSMPVIYNKRYHEIRSNGKDVLVTLK